MHRWFQFPKTIAELRIARPPFRSGNKFLDSRKGNIVIPNGESGEDEGFALGKLPPQEHHILSQNLGMLCQGEWQSRSVVISTQFLMICLTQSDDILDKVPLVLFVSLCCWKQYVAE